MSLLEVRGLSVQFQIGGRLLKRNRDVVRAVDRVQFDLEAGETLALVGESGSGKSTLARAILGLIPARSGTVNYTKADGERVDLHRLDAASLRALRPEIQIVFQDPGTSLNPRFSVRELLSEAPRLHFGWKPAELESRVGDVLDRVGLGVDSAKRYPHEFSAGQRQRIAIARALILEPRLLVCDEVVSSLDVSVQAGILNLLRELQEQSGLAYLFIAHDLAVVRVLAHRIAVMKSGQLVEVGRAEQVLGSPAHAYTRSLLLASS